MPRLRMRYSKKVRKIVKKIYKEFMNDGADMCLFPVSIAARLSCSRTLKASEAIPLLMYLYWRFYRKSYVPVRRVLP